MSWQHLNQPQGWIGVISLSLSLSWQHLHHPCVTGKGYLPRGCNTLALSYSLGECNGLHCSVLDDVRLVS